MQPDLTHRDARLRAVWSCSGDSCMVVARLASSRAKNTTAMALLAERDHMVILMHRD